MFRGIKGSIYKRGKTSFPIFKKAWLMVQDRTNIWVPLAFGLLHHMSTQRRCNWGTYNPNTSRQEFWWRDTTWERSPWLHQSHHVWVWGKTCQAHRPFEFHGFIVLGLHWLLCYRRSFSLSSINFLLTKRPKAFLDLNSSYKTNYDDLSMNDSETYGLNFLSHTCGFK